MEHKKASCVRTKRTKKASLAEKHSRKPRNHHSHQEIDKQHSYSSVSLTHHRHCHHRHRCRTGLQGPQRPQGPQGRMGLMGMTHPSEMTHVPDAAVLSIYFDASNEWIEQNKEHLKILEYIENEIVSIETEKKYIPKPGLDIIIKQLNLMNSIEITEEYLIHNCENCNNLFFNVVHNKTNTIDLNYKDIILYLVYLELTDDKLKALKMLFE